MIDLEPYYEYHPGGIYSLTSRIGYSIDLPFNGHPYSGIESDKGSNEGHMHSNEARVIAQSLVIGRYEGTTPADPNSKGNHKD